MDAPYIFTLVCQKKKQITEQERFELLEHLQYNVFSFPAKFIAVDYLSDSGTAAMFASQWAQMFYGDESYGRNDGYFILLEALRDTFERVESKNLYLQLFKTDSTFEEMKPLFIGEKDDPNTFFNSSLQQLQDPNSFLTPQGRCAEFLLFSSLNDFYQKHKPNEQYFIPSNGFFDTTRANCANQGLLNPVDFFSKELSQDNPADWKERNDFKGNLNPKALEDFIKMKGKDNIPLILMTVTNNTAAGQPVSLKNLKQIREIGDKYDIPVWIDSCRFAENAYFIHKYEHPEMTIKQIVCEMFKCADGFHISLKKDAVANMGGGLFFKNKGLFAKKFPGIGSIMKEKQILIYGNDSYGGMSGRDIMCVARGLYEVTQKDYLEHRVKHTQYLAEQLANNGVPVLLPPGGHAVYIDVNKAFPERNWKDFAGVGLTLELIKKYAIRCCELGAFAFEWDQRKDIDENNLPPNFIRLAIPRNMYGKEHFDYTVKAVSELLNDKNSIPNVKIIRGEHVSLRHFVAGLQPVYLEKK